MAQCVRERALASASDCRGLPSPLAWDPGARVSGSGWGCQAVWTSPTLRSGSPGLAEQVVWDNTPPLKTQAIAPGAEAGVFWPSLSLPMSPRSAEIGRSRQVRPRPWNLLASIAQGTRESRGWLGRQRIGASGRPQPLAAPGQSCSRSAVTLAPDPGNANEDVRAYQIWLTCRTELVRLPMDCHRWLLLACTAQTRRPHQPSGKCGGVQLKRPKRRSDQGLVLSVSQVGDSRDTTTDLRW